MHSTFFLPIIYKNNKYNNEIIFIIDIILVFSIGLFTDHIVSARNHVPDRSGSADSDYDTRIPCQIGDIQYVFG
ncbi:hypothetical protein H5J24_20650 [Chryseobacterium capnotolerans]|uniref:hypothetical protein n=1 Tax=Chryseobacterium capnotolerans TaxID=2759528 RepID=UPI001E38CE04|nr:hypothetical protein [Chryseobacterium capnotolerans]UHO37972.1 hypothetical protein H5J24_20650 [Chryseobacterium capnotolerans]